MSDIRAKQVEALEKKLKLWLNDAPFTIDGLFYNQRQMAEAIIKLMEDCEIEEFERFHEMELEERYRSGKAE